MNTRAISRWLLVGSACAWLACSEGDTKPKDASDAPARRVLLENLVTRVFVPTYESFAARAAELEQKASAYAKDVSEDKRAAAREAWEAAMAAWQRAEVMQVGPAARVSDATPGGQGLREEIYSWPETNLCGIDRALVSETYADAAKFASSAYPNVRGLDVMEVLLFDTWTETRCLKTDDTVTPAAWQALVEGDFEQRRAAYAYSLAQDVKKQADALVKAWKNGFGRELTKAGDGSDTFETTQDALNAVSDALFYLDTETKDMKLAIPAGLSMDCAAEACPERTEHPYAKVSKRSVLANLEAFRDVFVGFPPGGKRGDAMWGFADLLRSVSANDLAKEMTTLIDQSIAAVKSVDGSLEAAVAREDENVDRTYDKVQELCTRLKGDFLVTLSLNAPMTAAGDND